jgi:predicted acetyltransferase
MTTFDDIPINSYAGKVLLRLVDILDKMKNLYDGFGVEEYAEFFIASCDPKYRRLGLTTEMYRRNLEFLTAEGFQLAKSTFTSPYTRSIVSKFGFEEVCRLDYHEFVDEEGQMVFNPDELSDEHFAAVMVKELVRT